MNWTLELVVVPVSDIDRAKAFYMEKARQQLDGPRGEVEGVMTTSAHDNDAAFATVGGRPQSGTSPTHSHTREV